MADQDVQAEPVSLHDDNEDDSGVPAPSHAAEGDDHDEAQEQNRDEEQAPPVAGDDASPEEAAVATGEAVTAAAALAAAAAATTSTAATTATTATSASNQAAQSADNRNSATNNNNDKPADLAEGATGVISLHEDDDDDDEDGEQDDGEHNQDVQVDAGNMSARDKIKKYFDGDSSRKKIAPNAHNIEEFAVMRQSPASRRKVLAPHKKSGDGASAGAPQSASNAQQSSLTLFGKSGQQPSPQKRQVQAFDIDDGDEESNQRQKALYSQQQQQKGGSAQKRGYRPAEESKQADSNPLDQIKALRKVDTHYHAFLRDYDDINIVRRGGTDQNGSAQAQPLATEAYQKGSVQAISEKDVFEVTKEPKNTSGLWEFFTGRATRFVAVEGGFLYVLKKAAKDKFEVKSQRNLTHLFKLFNSKREQELRMAFYNRALSASVLPVHKTLWFKDKNRFLSHLRSELNKLDLDFEIVAE